jgi:hypothetical protein
MVAMMMTVASLAGAVSAASAADVVLYEVSEAVKLDASGAGKFKRNSGTLFGSARAGIVLCPQFIVDTLDRTGTTPTCAISVQATGKADDGTGIGPVSGTITVLMQDKNDTDAPEIAVISGSITGTMDMSPAFQTGRPLGSITGRFDAQGAPGTIAKGYKASGSFTGTFRLPFMLEGVSRPQYMLDDGRTVAIDPAEYVLRYPAVRLEVTITPSVK